MAKSLWDTVVGWLVGFVICAILTITIFKIGLKDPIPILLACYGWLGAVIFWYINFMNRIKKEDMKVIDQKIVDTKSQLVESFNKDIYLINNRFDRLEKEIDKKFEKQTDRLIQVVKSIKS